MPKGEVATHPPGEKELKMRENQKRIMHLALIACLAATLTMNAALTARCADNANKKEECAMLPVGEGLEAVAENAVKAPIVFEKLSLSENWCEAESREYELVWDGKDFVCSLYYGRWNDDEEREECLEKRVTLGKAEYDGFCEGLGKWGVRGWLGQSYSNPDVLDGEGFHLSIEIGGKKHWSGGSNSWPEGYREFYEGLKAFFK